MAHGYLREYDEGWDRGDDRDWRERGEWRDRDERDWRDRDPVWRGDRESHRDRSRGFMLSDDDRGDWAERRRSYSANPDDHYRSWRDRQMQSLDSDYEDYCREREQQFHKDFDTWRQNRGLRGQWGAEQGTGPDEQTFTPETTAVGNTMTTSETHEPQTTTEPEDTLTLGAANRRR